MKKYRKLISRQNQAVDECLMRRFHRIYECLKLNWEKNTAKRHIQDRVIKQKR